MQILHRNLCLAYFSYEVCISQSGHAIVPDHPHRPFFEQLYFKPMSIVSFWTKYKMCYLKKAVLLAKIKSI